MSQDTVADEAVPVPPASPRQVLLGLFILFQLAFLIVGNSLGLLRSVGPDHLKDEPKKLANRLAPNFADEEGHLWSWSEKLEAGTRRWMQLTGQDQDWSLFSSAGKATGYPVVLLLWSDPPAAGPSIPGSKLEYNAKDGFNLITPWDPPAENVNVVWLPSENAPRDPNNYFQFGKMRVRKYEGEFYMDVGPYPDEPREIAEGRLTRRMKTLITDSHDPAKRYLQWRLKAWQREHPGEAPPRQAILLERYYRIHGPKLEGEGAERNIVMEDVGWDGPFLVPQARWLVGAEEKKGRYVVEPFDFSDQRFHPLDQ